MTDPDAVIALMRKWLRERMNDLADVVATGHCADYATYREACGRIHGLAECERQLLDLTKKDEDDSV